MSQRIPVKNLTDSFRGRAVGALADAQLRTNFRVAMDSLMKKRADAFPDEEEREGLRELGNHIKARALSRLPDLLEQLETRLTANGVKVHWAETTEEANRIVHSIIEAKQGAQVVKGKSMVSEEMEMNDYLAERNIECLESEWASTSSSWMAKSPPKSSCRRFTRTAFRSPNCSTTNWAWMRPRM